MDTTLGPVLGIAPGIGLAAATGFRIFIPLLIAAIAARAGWIDLNESFAWLESTAALVTLGSAAMIETLAYYMCGASPVSLRRANKTASRNYEFLQPLCDCGWQSHKEQKKVKAGCPVSTVLKAKSTMSARLE